MNFPKILSNEILSKYWRIILLLWVVTAHFAGIVGLIGLNVIREVRPDLHPMMYWGFPVVITTLVGSVAIVFLHIVKKNKLS